LTKTTAYSGFAGIVAGNLNQRVAVGDAPPGALAALGLEDVETALSSAAVRA